MIDVIANVLDQGSPHISKYAVQISLIIAEAVSVIIEHLLDAAVKEDILHALRGNEVLDETPGLGGIEVFLAHRDQSSQRPVALGVHPDVNVPSILMGAVMDGGSAKLAGKVSDEKIAGVGELGPNGLYRVEQRANHFRGRIRSALIA